VGHITILTTKMTRVLSTQVTFKKVQTKFAQQMYLNQYYNSKVPFIKNVRTKSRKISPPCLQNVRTGLAQLPLDCANTPYISTILSFCNKKCGSSHLKSPLPPLFAKCPHVRTGQTSPECGRTSLMDSI